MAHWVNPDRGEMFFAKRIVFVEGETEKVVLSFVAGSGENKCFNPEVSIIDCGGKSNLPLYINIANAFKLKYIVVHDEDPLPDENQDGIEEKKKESMKKTFALNETISDLIDNTLGRIEIFSPEFEDVIGVSRSQRDRLGKPFAALEFLQNKLDNGESIPQRLSDVVLGIYQEPC